MHISFRWVNGMILKFRIMYRYVHILLLFSFFINELLMEIFHGEIIEFADDISLGYSSEDWIAI